ncbi:MAG: hypothetical protein WA919_28750 [Coleofasciculaceae cyanobacterium]
MGKASRYKVLILYTLVRAITLYNWGSLESESQGEMGFILTHSFRGNRQQATGNRQQATGK